MMKYIKLITFLLLFLFFSGFQNKPEDLIVGKWKLDIDTTRKQLDEMFKASGNAENDAFAKVMMNSMLEVMGNTVSEYKDNGELINTVTKVKPDGTSTVKVFKGTWKLKKDNKRLIVVENEREREIEIVSVSDDKMVLMLDKENKPLILTFVPVK